MQAETTFKFEPLRVNTPRSALDKILEHFHEDAERIRAKHGHTYQRACSALANSMEFHERYERPEASRDKTPFYQTTFGFPDIRRDKLSEDGSTGILSKEELRKSLSSELYGDRHSSVQRC